MIGTLLNVAGILVGGGVGLVRPKPLAPATESFFRTGLVAFTAFYGLRLMWQSLGGSVPLVLKQFLILLLAVTLGRLAGRLLHLQKLSNRLGQHARERLSSADPAGSRSPGEGFRVCTALFCAAPLGILGAVQDGTAQYFYPLAVKAVMDGLATMSFVAIFGWGVLLAAVPVLALQGTLTLLGGQVGLFLAQHELQDSLNLVGGLLVACVSLVMLGLKRIELADYLPSLVFAPLLTWLWR